MQHSRNMFFAALQAALDRNNRDRSEDRMPRQDVRHPETSLDDRDVRLNHQAEWMALFLEKASPLLIETAVIDTAEGIAKAVAEIAIRTPTEWSTVKTVVCCNHPLIDSTSIQQALDAIDIPMFFPKQGTPSAIARLQETLASEQHAGNHRLALDFRQKCAQATIGIFVADAAIAESATLVLRTTPDCPRIVSLLPSVSIAIVASGCLFDTFSRFSAHLARHPAPDGMTFITGPSKTADIEAVMVPGAHGPRSLHVLFVTAHCPPLFS